MINCDLSTFHFSSDILNVKYMTYYNLIYLHSKLLKLLFYANLANYR